MQDFFYYSEEMILLNISYLLVHIFQISKALHDY